MMRVRFGELSPEELLAYEIVRSRARAAWQQLRDGDAEGACRSIAAIDARLELAVFDEDGESARRAELSAFESSAWPLAELVLAQAPSDIGCVLSLGRTACPLPQALADVRATHQLELARATLRAGFGRGHLLEITLGIPGGTGGENEQNAAENLVRAVIGERLFETWVGVVHAAPAPRMPSLRVLDVRARHVNLSVDDLFATVSAAVLGVLQGLPPSPRGSLAATGAVTGESDDASRAEWTLLEVEPLAEERAGRKDDLLLASTCTPELLRCYLDGSPCSSRRFSRSGEQFVFVSYADDEPTMVRRVARRSAIESALSDCIAGGGAVTGVGFGLKTSYVDLALSDLETGLMNLVTRLRQLDLPARTFIQFFDSELEEEWLSIWPDSRLNEA
jgi:hypothetical protein